MSLDEAAVARMREAWDPTNRLSVNNAPIACRHSSHSNGFCHQCGAGVRVGAVDFSPSLGDRVRQDPDLLDFYSQKMVGAVVERATRRGAAEAKTAGDDNELILFVPDAHRPFHDQRAWDLMLAVGRNMRARHRGRMRIVCLGDLLDNYAVSSHMKDPARRERFLEEVASANEGLDELDAIGADSKDFVEGNHEWRYERFIADKAPELHGLTTIRQLLRLDDRVWSYTPYRSHLRVGKINITHDLERAGRGAHDDARAAFEGNAVIGHTHRMALSYEASVNGRVHLGCMFGWLGDYSRIDYRHAVRARREWVHGVGIGVREPDGTVHIHCAPFIGGKACVFENVIRV
jgi:hypothetical protein